MNELDELKKEVSRLADKKRAEASEWYFKTGKGQYGEGDVFLGLTVPLQRSVAKKYIDLKLSDVAQLLQSKYHEYRFIALEIVVFKLERGDEKTKKLIYNFYLKHTKRVNNWDLVDTSASYIVGQYLIDKPRAVLYKLIRSKSLWEKRIAIVATFAFIARGQFDDSIRLATLVLHDKHDLIQKATGWMLREMGKKDEKVLTKFLKKNYKTMPRTMLRYAIEKFPVKVRKKYLSGKV